MRNIDTELIQQQTGIRTYQLVVSVTDYMEGEIDDWPSNIQDGILEALEKKAQEVQNPLTIVYSQCGKDFGSDESNPKFYVCVIASEIVAADDRMFQQEKDMLRQLINNTEGAKH